MVVLVLGLSLLCLGGLLGFGEYRWRANTIDFLARLKRGGPASPPARFAAAEVEGLPAPATRYFRAVLRDGQPLIRHVRLEQSGEFLLRPARNDWRRFQATQHFATRPAGFVWDARIRVAPGLDIRVRDAFVDGTGYMLGSLMGLIRVVSVEAAPGIAAGALHRYLAEAAWFPTALLPSEGVVWTPLDDSTARATLSVAATTVSLELSR